MNNPTGKYILDVPSTFSNHTLESGSVVMSPAARASHYPERLASKSEEGSVHWNAAWTR